MKILIFCNGFPNKERPEKCVYNLKLCVGLKKLGVSLVIWTVRAWRPGRPAFEDYVIYGFAVRCWYVPQLPPILNRIGRKGFGLVAKANGLIASRYLRQTLTSVTKNVDLMHAVSALTPAIVCADVARKTGVPLLVQLIGSDVEYGLRDLRDFDVERTWLSGVTAVLANSRSLLSNFEVYAPNFTGVKCVRYRGVNLDMFTGNLGPNTDQDGKVLYLGGLSKMASGDGNDDIKGGRFLLETWAKYEVQLTDAGLSLSFGGPDLHYLDRKRFLRGLRRPDSFRLVNVVAANSVNSQMRSHSILVIPSLSEGLPNVLLEGMASGLAVVTTGVGGIGEATTPLQDSLYFDIGRSDQLVEQLCELARNPQLRRIIARNARARAAALFDAEHYPRELENIYSSMLRQGGG